MNKFSPLSLSVLTISLNLFAADPVPAADEKKDAGQELQAAAQATVTEVVIVVAAATDEDAAALALANLKLLQGEPTEAATAEDKDAEQELVAAAERTEVDVFAKDADDSDEEGDDIVANDDLTKSTAE